MKTLIVGSSGYIGRHVVQALVEQGAQVVGFDLVPESSPTAAGATFVTGNMTNLEEVMAAIVDHGIQRVVALGYFMAPLLAPECRDLLNAARVNIVGVTNLFEAARLARVERVVFASTVGIFGHQDAYGPEPINEETEPHAPKSLYGLMKLVNNAMAERYTKTHGIQIVKVHSAAVIGPGNTAFSRRMIQFPALGKPGFGNWTSPNSIARSPSPRRLNTTPTWGQGLRQQDVKSQISSKGICPTQRLPSTKRLACQHGILTTPAPCMSSSGRFAQWKRWFWTKSMAQGKQPACHR
jgi:nucleoside-diphosphate-sugar epimerase